jgi:hypothetical protein
MLPAVLALVAAPIWAATRQPIQTEIRAVSRLITVDAVQRLVQEQEYQCPMPPAPGVRAMRVAVFDLESTNWLAEFAPLGWVGCDEFPSSPHLDNGVLRARLLVRQRIDPAPRRGTFEGPWQLIKDGVEIGRGRMEGVTEAGTHDGIFFGGSDIPLFTFQERCDTVNHIEGLMKGTLDFPAASGAGKDRRFSAAVQGSAFGPNFGGADFGRFGMRIEGGVEVPCLNQPL